MDDSTVHNIASLDSVPLAKELGISEDDADTLLNDVIPILKRKLELAAVEAGSSTIDVQMAKELVNEDVPKVLANYALTELKHQKSFLIFLAKKLFGLTDLRARKLVDKIANQSTADLAEQLASQLGVHPSNSQKFVKTIIPKIRDYAKSMLRKRLQTEQSIEDPEKYYQFIVDNVFIDEFENHPFIRTTTDATNRAILNPEALDTAFLLLSAWTREVTAELR